MQRVYPESVRMPNEADGATRDTDSLLVSGANSPPPPMTRQMSQMSQMSKNYARHMAIHGNYNPHQYQGTASGGDGYFRSHSHGQGSSSSSVKRATAPVEHYRSSHVASSHIHEPLLSSQALRSGPHMRAAAPTSNKTAAALAGIAMMSSGHAAAVASSSSNAPQSPSSSDRLLLRSNSFSPTQSSTKTLTSPAPSSSGISTSSPMMSAHPRPMSAGTHDYSHVHSSKAGDSASSHTKLSVGVHNPKSLHLHHHHHHHHHHQYTINEALGGKSSKASSRAAAAGQEDRFTKENVQRTGFGRLRVTQARIAVLLRDAFATVSGSSTRCSMVHLKRYFHRLDADSQDKLCFSLSTTIGTILFFSMYLILFRFTEFLLEDEGSAYVISYVFSYLVSVVWQHGLNRWLVRWSTATPYWETLFQTYVVYGLTLILTMLMGVVIMHLYPISPKYLIVLTCLGSGTSNYYMLRTCFGEAVSVTTII